MDSIKSKIISLIKKNRISSVEVADALGKTGVIEEIKPMMKGRFIAGEVQYIYGHSESNWSIHEQGQHLKDGGVLFVDAFECGSKALFGDIFAKYCVLYKSIEGVAVNGFVRDAHSLVKEGFPVWCTGITPLGCYNRDIKPSEEITANAQKQKEYYEGGIMVCDDSGCTFIEPALVKDDTYKKLNFIELQEDIWYYCIDTLKWSTYKTICEKAYLSERDVLPESLRKRLEEFHL